MSGKLACASVPSCSRECVFPPRLPASVRKPFSNFSTACWQWKAALSYKGGSPAMQARTVLRSRSANSKPALDCLPSRVRVRCFHARSFRRTVDDDPVRVRLGGERVGDGALTFEGLDAHRKNIGGTRVGATRLMPGAPCHLLGWRVVFDDDQKIDVAVPGRLAARPRAEQDHPLRLEVFDNRVQQIARNPITWTSAVRPSRRPLRGLLRMRNFSHCHQ